MTTTVREWTSEREAIVRRVLAARSAWPGDETSLEMLASAMAELDRERADRKAMADLDARRIAELEEENHHFRAAVVGTAGDGGDDGDDVITYENHVDCCDEHARQATEASRERAAELEQALRNLLRAPSSRERAAIVASVLRCEAEAECSHEMPDNADTALEGRFDSILIAGKKAGAEEERERIRLAVEAIPKRIMGDTFYIAHHKVLAATRGGQ